ncbi:MAG: dehydrogenase [Sulfurovum sp. AS07-7]|nr:MAG: dehydrogenase [Sulfurovum sp. AS07-7]
MENKVRAYIYAFLSRIYTKEVDIKLLLDLKSNEQLLQTIGEDAFEYLHGHENDEILDNLNIDFNSLFVMNNQPIESSILDVKNEVLVGLQNPVMQFYYNYGYDLNLEASSLNVPDHIALELGFMQKLVLQNDAKLQMKFFTEHLLVWIPPFLLSIKEMSETPFYSDICDFTIDFLLSDYARLKAQIDD